jgi:hypothetical protein
MPVLKNPRHERFVQLLASGKTVTDAYEEAGYRRNDGNGPALARTEEINGRVTEIKSRWRLRPIEQKWRPERKLAAVARVWPILAGNPASPTVISDQKFAVDF